MEEKYKFELIRLKFMNMMMAFHHLYHHHQMHLIHHQPPQMMTMFQGKSGMKFITKTFTAVWPKGCTTHYSTVDFT